MNQFASPIEICSTLSNMLLSNTEVINSIFTHLPPPTPGSVTPPHVGSTIYLRQMELLRQFSSRQFGRPLSGGSGKTHFDGIQSKNLYRGVRQRHEGKWVAEIRLPHNRTRIWLGTYNSAELAAYAYDRASYKFHGEYARPNFPGLRDVLADDCPQGLTTLRETVDAKIQEVCLRLRRQRRVKKLKKEKTKQSVSPGTEAPMAKPSDYTPLASSGLMEEKTDEECSLARMPSYDPELIWEVLVN